MDETSYRGTEERPQVPGQMRDSGSFEGNDMARNSCSSFDSSSRRGGRGQRWSPAQRVSGDRGKADEMACRSRRPATGSRIQGKASKVWRQAPLRMLQREWRERLERAGYCMARAEAIVLKKRQGNAVNSLTLSTRHRISAMASEA